MKKVQFKQVLIGSFFWHGEREWKKVDTEYVNCCIPNYNSIAANDFTTKALFNHWELVEIVLDVS